MALGIKNLLGLSVVFGSPLKTFGSVYHYYDPFLGLNKKYESQAFLYPGMLLLKSPRR